ncbi:radical SAM protein [Candidatus Woesearchaeota archaeon]|nr:radical SAM protein [Candidatus Woesearchaeota archaeon]
MNQKLINQKRVLLIVPLGLGRYEKPTIPHAGIAYLAAFLRQNKHLVQIMDMRLYPNYKDLRLKIEKFKPHFIGMNLISLGYINSYKLINKIKKEFNIPFIVGGPHSSIIEEKILRECNADYVVVGEGEFTLLELVEGKPLKDILGLCWKNSEGKIIKNPPRPFYHELDKLPFPAYELFEMNKFLVRRIPLVSSRGCPHQCTYCSVKFVVGRAFRFRSAKNVVDEIEYWYKKGFRLFEFSDDNFTCLKNRVHEICDDIIKRGLKINFALGSGIRADKVDDEQIKKLKQAGCTNIAFGIESFDPYVLKSIKKAEPPEVIINAIKIVHKYKIRTQGNLIIGLPESTFESFLNDLRITRELKINNVRFYNLVPYPETELYTWIKENGTFLLNPEDYLNFSDYWENRAVFETLEFTAKERRNAFEMGMLNYMDLFLKEKFGRLIGSILYNLYKNRFIRENFFSFGKKVYMSFKWVQTQIFHKDEA